MLISSCTATRNSSQQPIITIDETPVTTEEFLYVFEKNNINQNQEEISEQDIREYLDLFVNFKLKVKEAESLGLNRDSAFINELEGYRKQLAQPYLTETDLLDSLVQVTYKRMQEEVSASHILVAVPEQAPPADTLVGYHKITELREKIDAGADFNALARQFSDDPSAPQNGGYLGYFSAMQMVYAFENAAYNLAAGNISEPVRTRFGYHLIQLHDKRPAQGRIQVAHILIRANEAIAEQDSIIAAQKAREIYHQALSNPQEWAKLCRQFSEDTSTKMKGGTLPWFKTGDVSNIPTFEKAAFALKEPGDISEPVKTPYGWHIIRLENRQGLEPFEELEPRIKANLTRNSRGDLNKQALVRRLKAENNFQDRPQVLETALTHATDSLARGIWKAQPQWNDQLQTLFSIGNKTFSLGEFYKYLENTQPLTKGANPGQRMTAAYNEYVEDMLIQYEEENLSAKYPDYRMLFQEYRDGLLLFQLMEDKVWNKAVKDTSGLKTYFLNNRHKYQWGERVDATIYNAADESVLNQVQAFLEAGNLEYLKYDFSGSDEGLNKAQIRILDNMAQQLIQGRERYLVLKYPLNHESKEVRELIMNHLEKYQVSDRVLESHPQQQQGFLAYITSSSDKDLADKLNQKQPLALQLEKGRFTKGQHPLIDQVAWKPGLTTLNQDGRWMVVKIHEVLPEGNQELDEIKGQVISDYQEELEAQWIDELKNKYQVTVNEKAIEHVYAQFEK